MPHLRTSMLVVAIAVLAACSSSGGTKGASSSGASTGAASTTAPASGSSATSSAPRPVYVSVGDSYAAGYQPSAAGGGSTTTAGFAYQTVAGAKAKGYDLDLINVGCGGATTTSVLESTGCPAVALGPGATPYPDETQVAAAERVLKANAGNVALITVSIGGNDVTRCARDANPVPCVTTAVASIKANVGTLLTRLRAAAGVDVPIVGITYPDVILGLYTSGNPSDQQLAQLSVTAFQTLINPALQQAYAAVGATFVDVTAATGAYGALTETTDLPPYGTIPVPVAKVCQLTFFCELRDIHPKTEGYKVIADLVVATLPAR